MAAPESRYQSSYAAPCATTWAISSRSRAITKKFSTDSPVHASNVSFSGGERERERVSSLPVNEAVRRGETDARQEDGIRDNFDERERLKLGNERSSGGQPV